MTTSSPSGIMPKFTIQQESGQASGPHHWKRIVEWYELGLVDDYTYLRSDGSRGPVKELVEACGVPPTIGFHSIFLAPVDGAKSCSQTQLETLYRMGFPPVNATISDELFTHLNQRLQLSDEALDAEDAAKFEAPTIEKVDAAAPSEEETDQNPEPNSEDTTTEIDSQPEEPIEPEEAEECTVDRATELEPSASNVATNTEDDHESPPAMAAEEAEKSDTKDEAEPVTPVVEPITAAPIVEAAAVKPESPEAPKQPTILELIERDIAAEAAAKQANTKGQAGPTSSNSSGAGLKIALIIATVLIVAGGIIAFVIL